MTRPSFILQPGPPQEPRIVAVEARGRDIRFVLEPGEHLLEAVRRGFADAGFKCGVVELGPAALSPFAYVMPALSKDGANAAFYSDTYRPAGVCRLEAGAMTFGVRDGAPFFHAHGLWREASGKASGGHILPEDTVVAERIEVRAFGIDGAMYEAVPDAETNFKIFGPLAVASVGAKTDRRVIALRLRPNQDFIGALEVTAARFGIRRGRIRGGVGSTIGAKLADGTVVENFATEVFVLHGLIAPGTDGQPKVTLDVGLVDYTGGMARGRVVRGENPVLMTFEIAIEVLED